MVETLHPGVYIIETPGTPTITGVSTSSGGFVGTAKKGPIDKPTLITSWSQFIRIHGGFYKDYPAPMAVFSFFQNGGKRMFFSRVVGTGSATSTIDLADAKGVNTLKVDALNVGAWGDQVSVSTIKFSSKIATGNDIATSDTSVVLESVQDLEIGDVIKCSDGVTTFLGVAYDINLSTKTVTFAKPATFLAGSGPILAGNSVVSSSQHLTSTVTTTVLDNGGTQVKLKNANNVRAGAIITLMSGSLIADVKVNAVNGSTIVFDPIVLTGTMTAGSKAVSQEFGLRVYDNGAIIESFEYLSMSDTNKDNYVENKLSGDSNQSIYISVTDLLSATTEYRNILPHGHNQVVLAAGDDGATPGDNDYIGDATPGAKSGVYLFDEVDEINMVSVPSVTTINVQSFLVDWCELRAANADPVIAVLETPLADDTPLEAQSYKSVELNKDSSHAAIYWPWLKVADPFNSSQLITIGPAGHVQGVYARVAVERGIHKAPANESVRNVVGLTYIVNDGEQDILNPIGVNAIRFFVNRGIRIWGARTMTSFKDGRHYVNVRRILNFIEESIAESTQFAVFEPNDSDLWDQLRLIVSVFLNTCWRQGMLIPRNDRSKAFFVKVDEENNPQSEIDAGRVNIEIGINPSKPAEFVIFKIGLWDGGRLLEEISQ